ncbi:septum formation initiator family protein [Candidatus Falkowbacteria bacterium]|nr:septum formation initiator family protein [Candidatus Falkowbacteria bacterium]
MTKKLSKSSAIFFKWQFFVLLAIIILLSIACVRQFFNYQNLLAQVSDVKNEISKLEMNKIALAAKIEQYASNAFFEAEARNKLNLKKKGETVVVIKNIPGAALPLLDTVGADDETSDKIAEKQKTNLALWWKYFFDD